MQPSDSFAPQGFLRLPTIGVNSCWQVDMVGRCQKREISERGETRSKHYRVARPGYQTADRIVREEQNVILAYCQREGHQWYGPKVFGLRFIYNVCIPHHHFE